MTYPTQKAAVMAAIAAMEPGETCDITIHEPKCLIETIDLCTCDPTTLHHGHEPGEACEPDGPPEVLWSDG